MTSLNEEGKNHFMESDNRLEKENYPFIKEWAVEHFGCFDAFVDVGLKYGRIDVLGVRDVGGDFTGDIETISIEV